MPTTLLSLRTRLLFYRRLDDVMGEFYYEVTGALFALLYATYFQPYVVTPQRGRRFGKLHAEPTTAYPPSPVKAGWVVMFLICSCFF
jgi:hypothetical protein